MEKNGLHSLLLVFIGNGITFLDQKTYFLRKNHSVNNTMEYIASPPSLGNNYLEFCIDSIISSLFECCFYVLFEFLSNVIFSCLCI